MDIQTLVARAAGSTTAAAPEGRVRNTVAGGRPSSRISPSAARLAAILGSLAAVAWGLSCGGRLPDTCEELGTCVAAQAKTGSSCDPTMDPKDEPCILDNAYGVFVAPAEELDGGSPASEGGSPGDGTASQPFPTIAQALSQLGSKTRIYVCNGIYEEQVSITTAVSLYGGLSCATKSTGRVWSYVGQTAQVTSPSPAYALSVAGVDGGPVTIEDLSFASPDAMDPGGSSIAALIASSRVNFRRVTLTAGAGANGAAGADGIADPNYTGTAPDGGSQILPMPDAGDYFAAGGVGGLNQCLVFGVSAGGHGGLGCALGTPGSEIPGLGTPGTATPAPPTVLTGRDGQSRTIPANAGTPANDDPGADGLAGDGGIPASEYGTLSAGGWIPSPGGDGDPGGPGQGGAGATDPVYGMCSPSKDSRGGGGGGAGGCGGSGGQGGGGGGASIALASLASTVDLAACTLLAEAGGAGGAGGPGQDGQGGGPGGDMITLAAHAAGAFGGDGAGGSGGAGGTGGISVDILQSGSTVTSDIATTQSARVGTAGLGGAAGMAGMHGAGAVLTTGMDGRSGGSGKPGTAASRLDLVSP